MAKRITVDASGRVVIPKPIREKAGLHEGRALEIRTEGDRVILEPVPEEARITEKNDLLIISSDLRGEVPDHRQLRDERLGNLAGLDE